MAEQKLMAYRVSEEEKNSNKAKDPENKLYLVCITRLDNSQEWDLIIGRSRVYEYIKDAIDDINFDKSFVLSDGMTLDKRKSIPNYMTVVSKYMGEEFDIEEYIDGDWDEEDFWTEDNLPSVLRISNADRLSMIDLMNTSDDE